MGVKTFNVVRDREAIEQMKQKLTNMGGTIILTEEELRATQMWKTGEVERPVLGFNCVGGASSTEICKALADKGVHVTYGGMSRKPVMAATSHMIFKDLELRGFWMGQWNERQGRSEARMDMYSHITQLVHMGQLDPPDHQFVTLDRYREALDNTLKGFLPAKYVFKID
jgi:trans-2-enoyl-CoA reductase